MTNKNYGFKVRIEHKRFKTIILRNVTEIHYNYRQEKNHDKELNNIAFESDIHQTGMTYRIEDILEFETELETKKEKKF